MSGKSKHVYSREITLKGGPMKVCMRTVAMSQSMDTSVSQCGLACTAALSGTE